MKKYDELAKEWKERRKNMLSDKENPICNWDDTDILFFRENQGKKITDDNPYVNILDVEEFELLLENEPFPLSPPAMARSGNPKSKTGEFFKVMHKEVTGDEMHYFKDQKISMERIMKEIKGGAPKPNPDKKMDLHELKAEMKKYANSLGFSSVGVTKVDRRYISSGYENEISYDTIILLGYEMPKEIIENYPEPQGELGAFYAYTGCARNVHKVADFIRDKGYQCQARDWKGAIKYPPHAVNAGLGNYSTYGVCITPEAGTRLKYCAILIDELPVDEPKDFNIEEFCSRCRMCQKSCPSKSIPKEEKMHKGILKRQTRFTSCFELMTTDRECMKCVRVCPFSLFGHEKCMDTLPEYYRYNLAKEDLDIEFLRGEGEIDGEK